MTDAWSFGGGPPVGDGGGAVTLIEGSSFCVSEPNGDIDPGGAQGLYFRDTRILSSWRVRVDGRRLQALAVEHAEPFSATFVGRTPPPAGHADSTVLVRRARHLGDGMREDLAVENLSGRAAALHRRDRARRRLRRRLRGEGEPRSGRRGPAALGGATRGGVDLCRTWQGRSRGVLVTGRPGAAYRPGVLAFDLEVAARGSWSGCAQVLPRIDEVTVEPRHPCGQPVAQSVPLGRLAEWRRRSPAVVGEHRGLLATLRQCQEDLGVLRIFDPDDPEREVVAAGAPWFMTLFGRDSLLTAWMALPLSPRLARGTLETLARFQGAGHDPRTEEQPGRILHEVRFGLRSSLALGGGNVYYGTVDASALFVMLLGELSRWGAPWESIAPLLPHADRALAWIDDHGDRDGDGFVEYERLSDRGLVNQGWKDSWDGVTSASGRLAAPPIALCEVQGYTYAAMVARSELAQRAGDAPGAEHWARRAARLRQAFNDAFWLPDRGYYALALDGAKRPVDALASNMGHCLWTGIVDRDKARAVAAHLVSPEMFSGWGVRTLATSMAAYNAMAYHNGSVWPHDTAIVAAGLMRYGFVEEARTVAMATLEAAEAHGGRLPELFCGFDRDGDRPPIPYPTACSPQAWAAAAPLLLLRTLLRLDPQVPDGVVHLAPVLPPALLPLRLDGFWLGGSAVSLRLGRQRWTVAGLPEGVSVVRRPRRP